MLTLAWPLTLTLILTLTPTFSLTRILTPHLIYMPLVGHLQVVDSEKDCLAPCVLRVAEDGQSFNGYWVCVARVKGQGFGSGVRVKGQGCLIA